MASRSPSTPLIILAPDSFKESLTAQQVCVAMQAGLEQVFPDARYVHVPMADGGEGTVQSLVDATGGTVRRARVTGPLGDAVEAAFGILGDGETAVIEMAAASGLELVPSADRDIRRATTYGIGELISVCLDLGVRRLVVGLGGSATNDGGAGMAQALGAHLLDASGRPLPHGGAPLANLARIDVSGLDPRLRDCAIEVASDVTNPLCGPTGASAVYGPQKGATPTDVTELDAALEHYADIVRRDLGRSVGEVPGAGAAGGLGAGLLAFTQARISSGIDIVIRLTGLVDHVAEANLVLTGEGRMDGQTRFGKTPFGVASVARAAGTPVIGIAGSVGEGVEELAEYFDAIIPVIGRVAPLSEVLAEAASNVERTCANVGRLIALTIADR